MILQSISMLIGAAANITRPELGPRHGHIARFNMGPGQQGYCKSDPELLLPVGAVDIGAPIADNGISSITEDAGIMTTVSRVSGCTLSIADIDRNMSRYLAEKLAGGFGSRHKRVEIFAQRIGAPFFEGNLLYTFIIENYQTKFGNKVFTLRDVNRATDVEVFTEFEHTLAATLATGAPSMRINASQVPDYRFQRSQSDPFFPGQLVGYFRLDDGDILAYDTVTEVGRDLYDVGIIGRGLFGTDGQRKEIAVDPDTTAENGPKVKDFPYFRESVKDAIKMVYHGSTYDDRVPPAHWHIDADVDVIDEINIGSADDETTIEVEEPGALTGKEFVEKYALATMDNAVLKTAPNGLLQLIKFPVPYPDAAASFTFDDSNVIIESVSPVVQKQTDIADPITLLWDYDPLTEDFANQNISVNLVERSIHGGSKPKTVELPGAHSGIFTGPQLQEKLVTYGEFYSSPTITVSMDLISSEAIQEIGTLVKVNLTQVSDDYSRQQLDDINRTMLIIGRRYNTITRRMRYFLVGTSGRAVEQSSSVLTQHLSDEEFKRNATRLSDVIPIVDNRLEGQGHVIAPGKYYHEGPLTIAPGFVCDFSRAGSKFHLAVTGYLDWQAQNPFRLKGMSKNFGGAGESEILGAMIDAQPGRGGFFGTSHAGGAFAVFEKFVSYLSSNEIVYQSLGEVAVSVKGIAGSPGKVAAVPRFTLATNNGQLIGVPADLSGSGGPGGKATRRWLGRNGHNMNPGFGEYVAPGHFGAPGGMGMEVWSRGGDFSGQGYVVTSGGDSAELLDSLRYENLIQGRPGPAMPGAFVWINDDPRTPLPTLDEGTVIAATGLVPGASPAIHGDPNRVFSVGLISIWGGLDVQSHYLPTPSQNYARSASIALYTPRPEITQRRPSYGAGLEIARQLDRTIKLIPTTVDAPPSDGLPGDFSVATTFLDGTNKRPPAWIKGDATWRRLDWDAVGLDYRILLQEYRAFGVTSYIYASTRPTGQRDRTLWFDSSTGLEWILFAPPGKDVLRRDNGAPLGKELIGDVGFDSTARGGEHFTFTQFPGGRINPFNTLQRAFEAVRKSLFFPGSTDGDFEPKRILNRYTPPEVQGFKLIEVLTSTSVIVEFNEINDSRISSYVIGEFFDGLWRNRVGATISPVAVANLEGGPLTKIRIAAVSSVDGQRSNPVEIEVDLSTIGLVRGGGTGNPTIYIEMVSTGPNVRADVYGVADFQPTLLRLPDGETEFVGQVINQGGRGSSEAGIEFDVPIGYSSQYGQTAYLRAGAGSAVAEIEFTFGG